MSVEISRVAGRTLNKAGEGKKTQSAKSGKAASSSGSHRAGSSGNDQVSLTETATRLQELEAHIASLPATDVQRVSDVQRSLASGSFHFEPVDAADNLIAQERSFALLEK